VHWSECCACFHGCVHVFPLVLFFSGISRS
jgi:hypothetical protein